MKYDKAAPLSGRLSLSPVCRRSVLIALVLQQMALVHSFREDTQVITGSKHIARVGAIHAPPTFPKGAYDMDKTTYVFILENVALSGSVQLESDIFDLHPNSWVTVRHSKYPGYLGPVVARYNFSRPLPRVVLTDTCCLRVEFQTGCCGPAVAGTTGVREFTGFRANYKFVPTLYKGRREDCHDNKHGPKLCNGECMPALFDCPCSKYGQFRCGNRMCVPRDLVCNDIDDCGDQTDELYCRVVRPRSDGVQLYGIYALKPILFALCSVVAVAGLLILLLSVLDKRSRQFCTEEVQANTTKETGQPTFNTEHPSLYRTLSYKSSKPGLTK